MYYLFFLSVICEIPPWRLTLRHLAPYSALCCGVLADSHNSAPFKNVQFEPPQKPAAAGDVRVTQVEIPSLLGCSISLACDPHTHTGEEGIRPPPSLHLHLSSVEHPSIHPAPPSVLVSGVQPEVVDQTLSNLADRGNKSTAPDEQKQEKQTPKT